MFEAKKPQRKAYPKRFSQLQQTYSEKRAFANRRASDEIGNREILRRLSGSFTAPKLKLVTLLLGDFFSPVISLNDLNDLKIIEARSLNVAGLEHAVRKPERNHYFEIFHRIFMINLKLKIY